MSRTMIIGIILACIAIWFIAGDRSSALGLIAFVVGMSVVAWSMTRRRM